MKIQTKQNRQVRNGTFETNSSSTHSISIQTISNTKPLLSLVEDNILYPSRLQRWESNYGDVGCLACRTRDSKAAIVADWIKWFEVNISALHYEFGPIDKTLVENNVLTALSVLKARLHYSDIVFESKYCLSNVDEEGQVFFLDLTKEWGEVEKQLGRLIDVITDDTKEIVDTETPC